MQTGQQPASLDLGGAWSFAYSLEPPAGEYRSSLDLVQAGLPLYRATVPGNLELDLQAAGIIGEPFYGMNIAGLSAYERAQVWYSRRFRAEERPGSTAELVFEGLDCCAEVYLDGVLLGMADNMLIAHTFRLDGLLPGEHELLVHIRPAVEEARRYPFPPSLSALQSNYESLCVCKTPRTCMAGTFRQLCSRILIWGGRVGETCPAPSRRGCWVRSGWNKAGS